MKESVKNLQENLECVKIEVDKINQSSDLNTSRQLSDIKSDIATVKGLLLSRYKIYFLRITLCFH